MRYLLALFLPLVGPPLAVLSCGRFAGVLVNLIWCLLGWLPVLVMPPLCLVAWIPSVVHAFLVVNHYQADLRTVKIAKKIARQRLREELLAEKVAQRMIKS